MPIDGEPADILFILDMPFNEDHEKDAAMRLIGDGLYEAKAAPVAACLSAEAWHQVRRVGASKDYCQPRHDPDRREIIIVMAMTIGGEGLSQHLSISRGAGDVIIPGEWSEVHEGVKSPLLAIPGVSCEDS